MKPLRCLLAFISLFLLTSPAQSQWFTSVPPRAGATAVDTAGAAPADSSMVLAWNLDGQLNLSDYLRMTHEVLVADSRRDDDFFRDLEEEVGRSPEEILSYFTGAGFVALKDGPLSTREAPQVIIGLSVKDSQGLETWLAQLLEGEGQAQSDGFQFYFEDEDDFTMGVGPQWLFFAFGKGSRPYAVSAFQGERPQMKTQTQFRQAFAELGYRESGIAVYMNKNFYPSLLTLATDMVGMKSKVAPALWDYGAGAIDFKLETGDLFLKISGDSQAALALGAPGGLKPSLFRKVPSGLNSYLALDMAWYGTVLESVADEYAPLNMVYQMARQKVNSMGDLSEAFSGPVVVGSDIFDRLKPGSPPPTVVAIAEVENTNEAHRLALKLSQSEMIDHPAEPQVYTSPQDFSLRLDSSEKELRLVWGPRLEEFLKAPPHRSRSTHSLVKETLDWSEGELALLAFFDLQEIVGYWRTSNGSGEERMAREFVRQFLNHSRLQGVIAVKSGPAGVHYKLRGLACSPLIPAGILGGFTFGVSSRSAAPNSVEVEEQPPSL
jgi:hypothetical protein